MRGRIAYVARVSMAPRFNPRPGSKPAPPPKPPPRFRIDAQESFRGWLDAEIREMDLVRVKLREPDEAVGIVACDAWVRALQRVRVRVFGAELEL